MIEGYSVDEAASVLGVPKGRVWELLARGILAGTPEDGGGMRVYLQGRPMEPIVGKPLTGRPDERSERHAGANGNGGEHGQPGFEASPFRELLTEFRNLTERYGQALLALGEARGEVASLRTRVELLEARVDLRLPSPPLVQWSPPQPAPPLEESERSQEALAAVGSAVAPAVDEPEVSEAPAASTADVDEAPGAVIEESPAVAVETPEAVIEEPPAVAFDMPPAPAQSPKRNKPRPRRRRQGARSATASIADALARAQDPTVSQLPGGDEAQAAFNALRERIRRETLAGEAPEPTEVRKPAEARELTEASEPTEANVPTQALTPEPDDVISLAEAYAPAEAVELDPLLADEELGGSIQELPTSMKGALVVEEAPAVAEAPVVEETALVRPTEPVVPEESLAMAAPEEDVPAPAYNREWDEPDWIAEEDVDWGSTEAQAPQETFAMGESPEIGWAELPASDMGQSREQLDAPDAEKERNATESSDGGIEVEQVESFGAGTTTPQAIEVEKPGSTSGQGVFTPGPRDAPADEVRGQGAEQTAGPEEELMWLGDEFRAGPVAWSSPGRVSTIPRQTAPVATVSEAEDQALSRLAVERGWDDAELDAIRSLLAQPGRVDLQETELDATASATPDVETQDAEARNTETRDAGMRDTATRDEKAPAEETRYAETRDAETQDEEAFDWERGPSAWNPPPEARSLRELPGAVELDQAMAAFEVSAWSKEAVSHAADERSRAEPAEPDQPTENREVRQWDAAEALRAPPAEDQRAHAADESTPLSLPRYTATQQDAPDPASAVLRPEPPSVPPPEPPQEADDDWLRGRRGPAANAYRRLRRLFP